MHVQKVILNHDKGNKKKFSKEYNARFNNNYYDNKIV